MLSESVMSACSLGRRSGGDAGKPPLGCHVRTGRVVRRTVVARSHRIAGGVREGEFADETNPVERAPRSTVEIDETSCC